MQKFILVIILFSHFATRAQTAYFQQGINYTIDVTLDDESHILKGFEKIEYTNHSKDTLRNIFFHLWANAYQNDRSAYCEQEVENKQTAFYFSKEDDRGFIDSLHFKIDDEDINISEYNNQEDIQLLELNHPLLPGKSIVITTPFRLVIPAVFSRLGHDGQSYQISQWYPKPAVYDVQGWHPIPYLDQGEFYSEIGTYTVNITLPKNYIVAATGELQTASELEFLETKLKTIDSSTTTKNQIPESATEEKKITFKQNNIHDFAWFANKTYNVEKKEVQLPSGKKVNCYSYYKPENYLLYKNSTKISAATIQYLSAHVGEYPYASVSVVDGKLEAGGGMEYPMVTVIGKVNSRSTLQTIIIHEVGHNWFYGILASNEREHPWMDEGINTFYERQINDSLRSTQKKKKSDVIEGKLNGIFLYQLAAKQNADQAIDDHASNFTSLNYGGIVYAKTANMLSYLQAYLGNTVFEQCMKYYFSQWQFKHPYPQDFRQCFESQSGKDLSWFFDQGISSDVKMDFKIKQVKKENNEVKVFAKNRALFTGPVPVSAMYKDSVIQTQWISSPYDQAAVFKNIPEDISAFQINAEERVPEIKFSNNVYSTHGLFHRFKPHVKFGSSMGLTYTNDLYIIPSIAYNNYDQLMLGCILHNIKLPNNKFQFAFDPMYSFRTHSLTGTGIIGYTWFPNHTFQRITISVQGNSFHHNESKLNIANSIFERHIKIQPAISFDFKNSGVRSVIQNNIRLQCTAIAEQHFNYSFDAIDSVYKSSVGAYEKQYIGKALFTHQNNMTFNPYQYQLGVEGNQTFAKLTAVANLRIDYYLKNKAFYVRAFAGKFFDLKSSQDEFALQNKYLNTTYTGSNDFTYDDIYLSRNEQKGALASQVSLQEGGFKIRTLQYANPLGTSDNWLTSINLRTDLPISLPLKLQLFLDAATFADAAKLNPSGNNALLDAGASIHFFKDALIFYVPFIMSKDFKDYTKSMYPKNRMLHTITFTIQSRNLNFLRTQEKVISMF